MPGKVVMGFAVSKMVAIDPPEFDVQEKEFFEVVKKEVGKETRVDDIEYYYESDRHILHMKYYFSCLN